MFVYSMKANTLKFFGVIAIALVALVSLILFVPSYEVPSSATIAAIKETINYERIKTNDDRIQFLEQFGWVVLSDPVEQAEITIPADFDKVMQSYNELQKQQGLDLSKYRKKQMSRVTYQISNYPNYNGTVYANLIIYKNRIIGGDISSSDITGFIHGFGG